MNSALNIVRGIIRRCGVDVIRHPAQPYPRFPPVLRARWMRELGIDVVVDVGGNVGQYAQDIRHYGYVGDILSFEPLSSAFEQLSRTAAADGKWKARRLALGDKPGSSRIHVAGNSTSSSMLDMLDRHSTAAPESRYIASEDVSVETLDNLLAAGELGASGARWLKIDVQGLEMSVLRGASTLLKTVAGIECEMSLVPLYKDEPLAEEVLAFLGTIGFRLGLVTEAFFDPESGRSLQLNGVFLRESKAN